MTSVAALPPPPLPAAAAPAPPPSARTRRPRSRTPSRAPSSAPRAATSSSWTPTAQPCSSGRAAQPTPRPALRASVLPSPRDAPQDTARLARFQPACLSSSTLARFFSSPLVSRRSNSPPRQRSSASWGFWTSSTAWRRAHGSPPALCEPPSPFPMEKVDRTEREPRCGIDWFHRRSWSFSPNHAPRWRAGRTRCISSRTARLCLRPSSSKRHPAGWCGPEWGAPPHSERKRTHLSSATTLK